MRIIVANLIFLLVSTVCLAGKPKPFFREFRLIDFVTATARGNENHNDGFKYLEGLADGDAPELDPAFVKSIGFSPEVLKNLEFRAPVVRAYAFRAVGLLGGPEAIRFLSAKTKTDFDPLAVTDIWPAVQVSTKIALLGQINDQHEIENFLETLLTTTQGYVADWAVQEACDRGLAATFPFVRDSIRKQYSRDRAEIEVQFCEQRMALLRGSTSRTEALGKFLRTRFSDSDVRLMRWVVTQLSRDNSQEAINAIEAFRTKVSTMTNADTKERLARILQDLDPSSSVRPSPANK